MPMSACGNATESVGLAVVPTSPDLLPGTLVGGAFSGLISRLLLHPLDTSKAKCQVHPINSKLSCQSSIQTGHKSFRPPETRTLAAIVLSTLRNEGPRGLYRGIGVSCLGSVPASCLYFSSYELVRQPIRTFMGRDAMSSSPRTVQLITDFTAGFVAEAASCVLWVPIDVCKERLQTQADLKVTNYRGSYDAMRTIVKVDGLPQLYKGYVATLASFGPMSALYFMLYQQFKHVATTTRSSSVTCDNNSGDHTTFMQSLVCGSFAGALASWITTPLDVVKLRLQVQRGWAGSKASRRTEFLYEGFFQGLRKLFSEEGLRGAYRGSLIRSCYHTPATAITIATMERIRHFYMFEL
eukprot:GHVS01090610.1.p1 GENE.GHVS01090610.1~~GHVS01090610.1.p1  ORF type:complete len:353 (+),score=23.94 GHVS01090610.1:147-1205(+)